MDCYQTERERKIKIQGSDDSYSRVFIKEHDWFIKSPDFPFLGVTRTLVK